MSLWSLSFKKQWVGNYKGRNCRRYFLSTIFLTVCHPFLVSVDGCFYEQASINKKLTKKQSFALFINFYLQKNGHCPSRKGYWDLPWNDFEISFLIQMRAQYCSLSEISRSGSRIKSKSLSLTFTPVLAPVWLKDFPRLVSLSCKDSKLLLIDMHGFK